MKVIVPARPERGDLIARIVAQKLSEEMRRPVLCGEPSRGRRDRGTGTAAAPADGHTILAANQDLVVQPLVKAKVPYDPFNSFAPVRSWHPRPK